MKNKIYIFDTTLRDGEQVPGCQLNTIEKIEVAKALDELGVDIIEAGFPISSPGDFQSVVEISKVVKNAVICPLTRAKKEDIDCAAESLKFAKKKRIHTFISSSDHHIIHQFNSTRDKIMAQGVEAVKHAKKYVEDVEFSAMDAGRTEDAFLAKFIQAMIEAGATTINIPDTTGYCLPDEFGKKIKYLFDHVKGIENVIVSVHCHNDLGLATANAIEGIRNGARQAEVTINGIGERAGNTALEEVVMILKTRKDLGLQTNINTRNIVPTSKLVSRLMHMPVQPNKAIVGKNAFAHSAGIHQHGVLKNRQTYEIINPEDIGLKIGDITLTARSGRAALKHRLEKLNYKLDKAILDEIYKKFLALADKKKEIIDEDLKLLMGDKVSHNNIKLEYLEIFCGTGKKAKSKLKLVVDDEVRSVDAEGNGPVDASFQAIRKIIYPEIILEEFVIQAIAKGSDDIGKVNVQLNYKDRSYFGFGADTDIVVASVKAYLDAINKI